MYKYFKELEDRTNFKTYFVKSYLDQKRDITLNNIPMDDSLLQQLGKVSPKVEILDKLIMGISEELVMREDNNYTYDEWSVIGDFFDRRREIYVPVRNDYFSLSNNVWNIYYMLKSIMEFKNVLIIFFPQYKDFIMRAIADMQQMINEISIKAKIQLPSLDKMTEVIWPDAWFITPNGYLYNSGLGHKQGNLLYPLHYDIFASLENNHPIDEHKNKEKIKAILKRGYITDKEMDYYSNLMYQLPTIMTPEVEMDIEREKRLLKLSDEEYEKISNQPGFVIPHTERSYQRNLVTLIVGHLAAEEALYDSFALLNDNSDKKKQLDFLRKVTMNNMDDILVRFCHFNILSSIEPRRIVTSSMKAVRDFSLYLDKGWSIEIVPDIIYDRYEGTLKERDLKSPMISRYLDKEIDNYDGKGKVLVYRI